MYKYKKAIAIVLLNILCASLPFFFGHIRWFKADDYLMNLIACGQYGWGSSEFLLYQNILFGEIVKGLYQFFPDINMYAILNISLLIMAFSVMEIAVSCPMRHPWDLILITGMSGFLLFSIYHLTFTIIAVCICGAGIVTAMSEVLYEKRVTSAGVLAWLLFAAGLMIRKGNVRIILFIFMPLVCFVMVERKAYRRCAVFVFSAVLMVFLLDKYNAFVYNNTEGWEKFLDYNSSRAAVVDSTPISYESNREQLEKQGFSENDLKCVYAWIFADNETFSADRLKVLADMKEPRDNYELNAFVLLKQMLQYKYNYFYLAFLILLALFMRDWTKRAWIFVVLTSLLVYGEILVLLIKKRAVESATFSIYLAGAMTILFYLTVFQKNRDYVHRKRRPALWFILIGLFIGLMVRENQIENDGYRETEIWLSQVNGYVQSHTDLMFVGSSGVMNPLLYKEEIFSIESSEFVSRMLKLGSSDFDNPHYYDQIDPFLFQSPGRLLTEIARNDRLRCIFATEEERELVVSYLRQHLTDQIQYQLVKQFDNGFGVYYLYTG